MKSPLLLAAIVSLLASPAFAQTLTKSVPVNGRPIPDAPAAPLPETTYSLQLNWNESKRSNLSVAYQNTSDKPLRIDGVQTSGNIFMVDYPKTIAPGGTGNFIVLFDAKPGTQSDSDVIRVKTSEGEKTLKLNHDRAPVITFESQQLSWQVGEAVSSKFVVLHLGYGVKAVDAKAMLGNTVRVEDAGGGAYRIVVTPKSTAKGSSFPVIVTLSPEIPGVSAIVSCVIN